MSCGAIGKQNQTDSKLPKPQEADTFETVAITFKMDAKNNDPNEHEQKKSPLTTIPLLNSCLSQSISHPGGGDPAYERDGDACRLA